MNTKKQEYSLQYDKENTRQIKFKFSLQYDADILEKLDSVPNKQGYIKSLIRADIANPRAESENQEGVKIMKKYQVIGGQYEQAWKGESDSIRGAKIIAARNKELWDNWQGWHIPAVYRAEDCEVITAAGMVTVPDGREIIVHKPDAEPID